MTAVCNESEDIAEKLKIAKSVISAIDRDEGATSSAERTLEERFEEFTGWPADDTLKDENINFFLKYHKSKDSRPVIDLVTLRSKLVQCYVVANTPPTAEQILDFVAAKVSDKNARHKFFEHISLHGFVWRQIPNSTKALFVESSHRIAHRIGYLQKIRRFRESKKPFLYVSISPPWQHRFVVSTKLGRLGENDEMNRDLKVWFREVLEKVPEPSVFVYPELWEQKLTQPNAFTYPQSWKIKVTPFVSKAALMKFLTHRGIPFDPNSHRLELYELAKRFSKVEEDEISLLCKQFGHECIARPHFTSNIISKHDPLDIFSFIAQVLPKQKFADKKSSIDWKFLEDELIKTEKQMYDEDIQMENKIDELLTHFKYDGETPNYLTDYSEVMKYDLEFGPASAFF